MSCRFTLKIQSITCENPTIFVSCEPLLESIDLNKYILILDWVIVGGGCAYNKGRAMEYKWVEKLYLQRKTSFFFKQWGDSVKRVKMLHKAMI